MLHVIDLTITLYCAFVEDEAAMFESKEYKYISKLNVPC